MNVLYNRIIHRKAKRGSKAKNAPKLRYKETPIDEAPDWVLSFLDAIVSCYSSTTPLLHDVVVEHCDQHREVRFSVYPRKNILIKGRGKGKKQTEIDVAVEYRLEELMDLMVCLDLGEGEDAKAPPKIAVSSGHNGDDSIITVKGFAILGGKVIVDVYNRSAHPDDCGCPEGFGFFVELRRGWSHERCFTPVGGSDEEVKGVSKEEYDARFEGHYAAFKRWEQQVFGLRQ